METHLENHKSVHRAIEEFQMSLKEAKLNEVNMLIFVNFFFVKTLVSGRKPKHVSPLSDSDGHVCENDLFREAEQTGEAV